MSTYGSIAGVASFTKHMTAADGTFTEENNPTEDDVEAWLMQRSAQLTGWLATAGYAVPVSLLYIEARAVLDYYANVGAAGNAELSLRSGGFDNEDENKRENKLLAEFYRAEKFILSGALAGMGVPSAGASSPIAGLFVGGRSNGQYLQPIFTRTGFGNNPTAENGLSDCER